MKFVLKTQAEVLMKQVSDSVIYKANNQTNEETFSTRLLLACIDCRENLPEIECAYVFHDHSTIYQNGVAFALNIAALKE